jgi:hypothetical protein
MSEWITATAGPIGIVLGWGLSEWSARLGFGRQIAERRRQDRVAICLDVMTAAETAAVEARDAVAMTQQWLRDRNSVPSAQLQQTIEGFNTARITLGLNAQRLRIVGPATLHAAAQQLVDRAAELFAVAGPLSGGDAKPVGTEAMGPVLEAIKQLRDQAEEFSATAGENL